MTVPLLEVDGLSVDFPVAGSKQRLKAVDGVSFSLAEGETLGIVGESGCGKSTLARAVLRLIEPTAGRIVWDGQDLRALSPRDLRAQRQHLQIIFQDPLASLDPRMTVRQILERPLATFGIAPALERRARVIEAMEQVGLPAAWMDRYPHEFSGGQCQRIGIARAVIVRPRLIVCDEPVSALDVSIQAQIMALLGELRASLGLSLLFISHNLSVVRQIGDRVMVLYLGRVMEIATRDQLFARPLHPYTQALIAAAPVPDPAIERSRPRSALAGDPPSPIDPPSGCHFRTRCPGADALCAARTPELRQYDGNRFAACHHIDGIGMT
jgi:oligopeptide transport system ATP-binding protein